MFLFSINYLGTWHEWKRFQANYWHTNKLLPREKQEKEERTEYRGKFNSDYNGRKATWRLRAFVRPFQLGPAGAPVGLFRIVSRAESPEVLACSRLCESTRPPIRRISGYLFSILRGVPISFQLTTPRTSPWCETEFVGPGVQQVVNFAARTYRGNSYFPSIMIRKHVIFVVQQSLQFNCALEENHGKIFP